MSDVEASAAEDGEDERVSRLTRLEHTVDALEAAVTVLENKDGVADEDLEALKTIVTKNREAVKDVREEHAALVGRVDALTERVDEIDARTDLLQLVEHADDLSARQRSVALLQHLKRAADRERDRGRQAKASVDRDAADEALHHPDVERTTIYKDMDRAADLVDDEHVCTYDDGVLRLNLERGTLPSIARDGDSQ